MYFPFLVLRAVLTDTTINHRVRGVYLCVCVCVCVCGGGIDRDVVVVVFVNDRWLHDNAWATVVARARQSVKSFLRMYF